jgi:hypothetical protein
LGEQIVAGVTRRDPDLIGLAAKAHDIVSENYFSFCHTKIGCSCVVVLRERLRSQD